MALFLARTRPRLAARDDLQQGARRIEQPGVRGEGLGERLDLGVMHTEALALVRGGTSHLGVIRSHLGAARCGVHGSLGRANLRLHLPWQCSLCYTYYGCRLYSDYGHSTSWVWPSTHSVLYLPWLHLPWLYSLGRSSMDLPNTNSVTPSVTSTYRNLRWIWLLLCDCVDGGCRLFYVDAERKMELKGTVPWSDEINAELMPRGCFRIRVPGRTYYLEDAQGSAEMAELWVRTLLKMRARLSKRSAPSGGGDAAPMPPRNGPTREPGSRRAWPQVALPHWLSG